MTLQDHVSRTAGSYFYQLRRIKSIRRSLPTSTAVQLVNNFIISRVDYCNSILGGLPNQSYAGNTQLCSTTHIRSLLVRPCHISHQSQIALATNSTLWTFQVCNACVQSTTQYCFFIHCPILCHTTHHQASQRAEIRGSFSTRFDCSSNETQFGGRSFTVTGPSIWNSVLDFVKDAESLDCQTQEAFFPRILQCLTFCC